MIISQKIAAFIRQPLDEGSDIFFNRMSSPAAPFSCEIVTPRGTFAATGLTHAESVEKAALQYAAPGKA